MSDAAPQPGEDVRALPAFERVQTRFDPDPGRDSGRRRWIALLVALALAGGAATAWWLWPTEPGTGDVLVRLVETADAFSPELATTQPDVAREFVYGALGWDVAPPDLPSLTVVGVGIPSIGTVRPTESAQPAEVQVPTYRYEGADGERAVVYAYDYILLDRVRSAFDLPDATYAVLSEPTPVDTRVVDGRFVVTWRRRAMIFSAVTADEAVAERIRQTVAS